MTQSEKIDKIIDVLGEIKTIQAVHGEKIDTQIGLQKKTNGRVTSLEVESEKRKEIIIKSEAWHKTRSQTCPKEERLDKLEDEIKANQVTKMFVFKVASGTSIIIGIIWGVMQIFGVA